MAIKSSNTQGNPYHDENTGEFTGKNESSFSNQENKKTFSFALKSNFDIGAAKNDLQKAPVNVKPQIGSYKEASSIEEAVSIGRSILPGCLVNYSNGCDLEKVNELNKALSDISNKFPEFVENGLLNAFGDGLSLKEKDLKQVIIDSALNVIKNDSHFNKIYDDFFKQSQIKYNLKDEDRYDEKVFSHFMCMDRGFNIQDYAYNYSGRGGASAYYQVSQANIFSPQVGGKGINGAIKIYTSVLKKPTQEEVWENKEAVRKGFHFDYGQHSYTYATGVHELGHSIFTIAYKKCNDEERQELDQLLIDGIKKDYNQVSGYGHYNSYEQEAEAVSDVFCRGEQATPHNKKMVAWLEKVHSRLKNSREV